MSADDVERRLGEELHNRLRAGDLTASEEIARLFFPRLVTLLRRSRLAAGNADLADTACADAMLSYLRRPEQFKPESLSLFSYLKMAAFGDLGNAVTSRAAQNMRVVELSEERPEHISDQGAVEDQLIAGFSTLPDRLDQLFPEEPDREMLYLMMNGVRETATYAAVLGVSDRPPNEQAAIVKRHKDRLKKTIQRNIDREELR